MRPMPPTSVRQVPERQVFSISYTIILIINYLHNSHLITSASATLAASASATLAASASATLISKRTNCQYVTPFRKKIWCIIITKLAFFATPQALGTHLYISFTFFIAVKGRGSVSKVQAIGAMPMALTCDTYISSRDNATYLTCHPLRFATIFEALPSRP